MMSITNIDDLATVMMEAVEGIQTQFDDPDDDWVPVMGLVPQEGENVMLALDGRWLENDDTKHRLVTDVMIPAINGIGAKTLATVFSAWVAKVPKDANLEDLPRPSDNPDRKEVVVVTAMDSFNVKTWMVEIIRTEDSPPTLAEWELIPHGSQTGRFIEEIQGALRDCNGQTDESFMRLLDKYGVEIDE